MARSKAHATTAASVLTFIGRLLLVVLILVALVISYFATRGFHQYREALDKLSLSEMQQRIENSPDFTPIEDLPDLYLQAVIAVEDHRFYRHFGFDPLATLRALANDVKAGAIVEGGSTITQQLAKNEYFTQEQTIERKIAEVFMAVTLEQRFSKSEILEMYVNSIYFGDGYEGIGQASRGYYHMSPSELSASQCTLLAGVPNAPSAYSPTEHPELAQQRQHQVLKRLVACDYLSESEAVRIALQPAA